MKSDILHILRERNDYVSGQELCSRFGVSRTAVWKAIRQLREEGYEIEAIPNRGYHITGYPDVVSAQEIESRLTTAWVGKQVVYEPVVDSTNNKAKRLAEEGAGHGTLVLADQQSQGKGRRGRSWSTPPGTAVAMTVIVRPGMRPEQASMLTLIMGLAVASACRSLFELDAQIKWPNDIVIGGKKLCGILTEMSAEMNEIHYLVIGTGINVNMEEFPMEIRDTATSLCLELGKKVRRADVIQRCLEYFEQYYDVFMETENLSRLQKLYNQLLVSRDRQVRVLTPGNEYQGISRGINDKGELLVERENGKTEAVYAGEVSVRGIYGYS